MITTIFTGIGAALTTGGFIRFLFKRQQKQIDDKVSVAVWKNQNKTVQKEYNALSSTLSEVVDALQGKTGETGLVSAVEAIATTVAEIRTHQTNSH